MIREIDIRVMVDAGGDEGRPPGSPPPPSEEQIVKALQAKLPGMTLLLANGGAVIDDIIVIGFS